MTAGDSPDLFIRKYLVNVDPKKGQIAHILADSSLWDEQETVRRRLRNYYFSPYFGFSSQIAASMLLNLDRAIGKKVIH